MNYTKEPWHVGDTKNGAGFVYGEDGWAIAQCLQTKDKAEANARRIVACVNACAGIPTSDLEEQSFIGVSQLQAAYLKQQRDELLVALKESRRELHACQSVIHLAGGFDPAYVSGAQSSIKNSDAVIAKVESEK